MQTAAFVMVKGPVGEDGKFVARPYTPTSTNGKYFRPRVSMHNHFVQRTKGSSSW